MQTVRSNIVAFNIILNKKEIKNMSSTNNALSFYVVQMGVNSYDLYNTITDKCILRGKDKITIKTFLDSNHPTHPFLSNSIFFPDPVYMGYENTNSPLDNSYTYTLTDPYETDKDSASISDYSFYCASFDYSKSGYCNGLSDENKDNNKEESSQLEFDFSYNKDNKEDKTLRELEEDIPYLGDNED